MCYFCVLIVNCCLFIRGLLVLVVWLIDLLFLIWLLFWFWKLFTLLSVWCFRLLAFGFVIWMFACLLGICHLFVFVWLVIIIYLTSIVCFCWILCCIDYLSWFQLLVYLLLCINFLIVSCRLILVVLCCLYLDCCVVNLFLVYVVDLFRYFGLYRLTGWFMVDAGLFV